MGATRFDAMQSELGVARNILADRLGTLVDAGVLEKVPYRTRPVRHEYKLTSKGVELHGTLVMLEAWGNKWVRGSTVPFVGHEQCHPLSVPDAVCAHCGTTVNLGLGIASD
jgi:DNA-binding HxlR family transcriptional regulator